MSRPFSKRRLCRECSTTTPLRTAWTFCPEDCGARNEFPNLAAVKESSTDARRVTAIRALLGDRLAILVGVDDSIVEGIAAGAVGWVAGLVNSFPRESVELFRLACEGKTENAFELYRWFLPLLRMDTIPKFIQYIKQLPGSRHLLSPRPCSAPRADGRRTGRDPPCLGVRANPSSAGRHRQHPFTL